MFFVTFKVGVSNSTTNPIHQVNPIGTWPTQLLRRSAVGLFFQNSIWSVRPRIFSPKPKKTQTNQDT